MNPETGLDRVDFYSRLTGFEPPARYAPVNSSMRLPGKYGREIGFEGYSACR